MHTHDCLLQWCTADLVRLAAAQAGRSALRLAAPRKVENTQILKEKHSQTKARCGQQASLERRCGICVCCAAASVQLRMRPAHWTILQGAEWALHRPGSICCRLCDHSADCRRAQRHHPARRPPSVASKSSVLLNRQATSRRCSRRSRSTARMRCALRWPTPATAWRTPTLTKRCPGLVSPSHSQSDCATMNCAGTRLPLADGSCGCRRR